VSTFKLSKRVVDALPTKTAVYIAYDTSLAGFGCRVTPAGAKSWIVEYRPHFGGRRVAKKRVTLGATSAIPPDAARHTAQEILARARLGEEVAADRAARRRAPTIAELAARYMAGERKVERFGWTFAPGDKVMQIENDYDKEVYNGDIGFLTEVEPDEGELTASFDGRPVTYGFGELDTLVPAYAATIHKSQGSEYPAVVIPLMTQHYAMLQRNLLYTGVTRGKRLVVLVGQKKAVAIAVRNVSGRRRWSKLGEWFRPRPAANSR
jgi:ATP-dependent exoDNAse (exonuclease V) alpha subunit